MCRRIAYQEASQTFGVISMRMDIQDANGTRPSRISASVHAASTSCSTNTKQMTGSTSSVGDYIYGDQLEVHSLLIIDQHTFEGKFTCLNQIDNFQHDYFINV